MPVVVFSMALVSSSVCLTRAGASVTYEPVARCCKTVVASVKVTLRSR